jgi:RHS repeat-associated protein
MPLGSRTNDVAGIKPLDFSHPFDPVKLDYYSTSIGVDLNTVQSVSKVRLIGVSPRLLQRNVELYISADGTLNSWTKLTDITWLQDQTGVTLQFKTSHQARYIKAHVTWDERGADNQPIDQSTMSGAVAQLLEVSYWANGQTTSWTYDSAGNRMNQYQTKGTTVLTTYTYYPNSSRMQSAGDWSFVYDPNGNLTGRTNSKTNEGWTYSYDLANRLTKVQHQVNATSGNNDVASYVYDIRNLRVAQTKAGVTTYYQYDQKGDILWSDDGTTNIKYVEALGETWAEVRTIDHPGAGDQPKTYYHAVDHEGTTNVVTDESGNVVWDGEYEAFGAVIRSNGTLDFTPSYTGKQYDSDTGLYYYNARFYEPELGRFLNSDPARSGVNWYEYALDNPLKFMDPTGLADQLSQQIMDHQSAVSLFGTSGSFSLSNDNSGIGDFKLSPFSSDRYDSYGLNYTQNDSNNQYFFGLNGYNGDPGDLHARPDSSQPKGIYDHTAPGPFFAPLMGGFNKFSDPISLPPGSLMSDSSYQTFGGAYGGFNLPPAAELTQNGLHRLLGLPGYDWASQPTYPVGGVDTGVAYTGRFNSALSMVLTAGANLGNDFTGGSAGGGLQAQAKVGDLTLGARGFASLDLGYHQAFNRGDNAPIFGARAGAGVEATVGYMGVFAKWGLQYDGGLDQPAGQYQNVQWKLSAGFGY